MEEIRYRKPENVSRHTRYQGFCGGTQEYAGTKKPAQMSGFCGFRRHAGACGNRVLEGEGNRSCQVIRGLWGVWRFWCTPCPCAQRKRYCRQPFQVSSGHSKPCWSAAARTRGRWSRTGCSPHDALEPASWVYPAHQVELDALCFAGRNALSSPRAVGNSRDQPARRADDFVFGVWEGGSIACEQLKLLCMGYHYWDVGHEARGHGWRRFALA
ncbi:hypothetical protein FQZ97_563960 [compost metagenome]